MPEMLFYEKPVPLSNITHADWKLDRSELRYEFADKINSVVLAGMLSSRKLVQDFAITAGDQSACAETADDTSEVSLSSLKRKGKESGTLQKRARLKQTTLVKTPSGVGKPVSASSKGVPTLKAVASTSKTPPASTTKSADALRRRLETKVSGIQTKWDKTYTSVTAKREAANKQALEVFRDAEKEAEQKYQAKLRQYDEREGKNRTQEEAAISRASEAIEKATLQREKAEAAVAKATAQLAAKWLPWVCYFPLKAVAGAC